MICIVGAGLTGLALAHELAKGGVEHVVLEVADQPGGVIRSARVDGRVLDFGPQRLRMAGALEVLVAELGLEAELVYAPKSLPLYVYADGALREVPFSLRSLVTGNLLTWRGKLRLLGEPLMGRPRADETVGTLLTRKLGKEAYDRLTGPLYGGLYASDPGEMIVGISMAGLLRDLGVRRSLLWSFARRRVAVAAAFSFRGGLQAMTDALYAAHAGAVRLSCPALSLARSGRKWHIETPTDRIEAETVVLACAAPDAARLLAGPAPDAARRLAALVYNPLAVVHLDAGQIGLRGLGYQVAFGEELATRGVTWNEGLFSEADRRGVCTAFLGGARRTSVVSEPDGRLGALAAREFQRVTGRAARVLAVTRTWMPGWDLSWRALEGLELPSGILGVGSWRSRPGIPGRLADARRAALELMRREN